MTLIQRYQGRARYDADDAIGPHDLFVSIPCRVQGLAVPLNALLDTAAEWCVLQRDVVEWLGLDGRPEDTRLSSRFGVIDGRLERLRLVFVPAEGEEFSLDATFFISLDCLERMRFALDPGEDSFSFAGL